LHDKSQFEVDRISGLVDIPESYFDEIENHFAFERVDAHPPAGLDIPLKYWDQRYRLFSKFDLGIHLDKESWYSV
jgi:hypothetical protein